MLKTAGVSTGAARTPRGTSATSTRSMELADTKDKAVRAQGAVTASLDNRPGPPQVGRWVGVTQHRPKQHHQCEAACRRGYKKRASVCASKGAKRPVGARLHSRRTPSPQRGMRCQRLPTSVNSDTVPCAPLARPRVRADNEGRKKGKGWPRLV